MQGGKRASRGFKEFVTMAKKKDTSKKDKGRPDKRAKPKRSTPPAPASSGSPKDIALLLLQEADQSPDPDVRNDLATKALALDPDAVDAYLILAEHARTRKEAQQLYQQAVAVGERSHAADKDPALRARIGLAHALWTGGRRDEAVLQARELLRLQPDDQLGARFTLAGWLLHLDRDDETAQLIEQFAHEELAPWTYTRALLAFRQHGDTEEGRKLLKRARKTNKHVADYMLGEKDLPADAPGSWTPGDPSEAMEYVEAFLSSWRATEGALDWLHEHAGAGRKNKQQAAKPIVEGPSAAGKKTLRKLPRQTDAWQVDLRQLPLWLQEEGKPVRPWVLLVFNPDSGQVVGNDTLVEEPSVAQVWDLLARTMNQPLMTAAHRPTTIHYSAARPWSELQTHWQEVDVRFEARPTLPGIDDVFPVLVEQMAGKLTPGILDAPGVTPELARRFYDAAAYYYRQSPWRYVGYESAVEVRCNKYESGPWYAVVMGQSGLTLGLALYDNLAVLRRLWSDELSDEENARLTVGTSVTYGDMTTLPIADLEACQKYGWPLARSDAYPSIFHKERGMSMRPPLAWELELMEAAMRALPDFVRRRNQEDTTPEEISVPAGGGQLTLRLAWVGETDPAEEKPPEPRNNKREPADKDEMLDALLEFWPTIHQAYEENAQNRPIILVDFQEERVYAYPYQEFKEELSPAGQKSLEEQYKQAEIDNQVVVFARDNEKRRLVSYSLDLDMEEGDDEEGPDE
jgi:hypothetical protein